MRCAVGLFELMMSTPIECGCFQLRVANDVVHHPHSDRVLGAVLRAQEEDLPCELLADLTSQIGRAVSAVEARNVGVCLLESCVFAAGECKITHDVEACGRRLPPIRAPRRSPPWA